VFPGHLKAVAVMESIIGEDMGRNTISGETEEHPWHLLCNVVDAIHN
jgi:hypothetical protein